MFFVINKHYFFFHMYVLIIYLMDPENIAPNLLDHALELNLAVAKLS